MFQRQIANDVHVDEERFRVEPIGDRVVQAAREVKFHAVREVPAVREFKPENCVALGGDSVQDGRIRGRTGVRLDVGVRRAKQ